MDNALLSRSSRIMAIVTLVMAVVTLVAAVLLPVVAILGWVFLDHWAEFASGNVNKYFDAGTVSTSARVVGLAIALAGAVIQAYGLLGLRHTFLEAANGRWLSAVAIAGFRRFAWVSVVMVLVGIFRESAYSVILTIGYETRPRELSIGFGSNEVKDLFMAVLLVFVAQVFTVGRQAEEENAAFL